MSVEESFTEAAMEPPWVDASDKERTGPVLRSSIAEAAVPCKSGSKRFNPAEMKAHVYSGYG